MVDLVEPDWREAFEFECARKPDWPRYLQEIDAFETVLKRWRRFHATLLEDGKHQPASAVDGMVALARLRIMPPRSEINDIARGGIGFQSDDHCWLSIAGEQWRIVAIEDRMLHLEKMRFDDQSETRQIDLNRAKWGPYIEAGVAVLEAIRERDHNDLGVSSPGGGEAQI